MYRIKSNRLNINAYTVIEVMITLVVTVIVISLVYAVVLNFKKQIFIYQDYNDKVTLFKRLDNAIRNDIYTSNTFDYSNGEIFLNKEGSEVVYKIEADKIYRSDQGTQDVFPLEVLQINLDTIQNSQLKVVLNIDFKILGDTINCFYAKENGYADMINKSMLKNEY